MLIIYDEHLSVVQFSHEISVSQAHPQDHVAEMLSGSNFHIVILLPTCVSPVCKL